MTTLKTLTEGWVLAALFFGAYATERAMLGHLPKWAMIMWIVVAVLAGISIISSLSK